MIIAVFLHLLRVYFTGSYRHPRQLNWMIGCGLLATTLGFGFTGYSLVYEQLSFWGATVAASRVTPGSCPPGVPTDPYVRTLAHTVPQITNSLRDHKQSAPREAEARDNAPLTDGSNPSV